MALASDWYSRASCHDVWPALDMVTVGSGNSPDPIIKEYCDRCPVVLQCGETALANWSETTGIWGGVYVRDKFGTHHVASRTRASAKRELETRVAILRNSEHAA